MRLRELKCKNCGASIKVGENETQVECKYCHTTFAVEDAYHDGYKFEKGRMRAHSEQFEKSLYHVKDIIAPVSKVFSVQYIISAVVSIAVFIVVIIIAFSAIRQSDSFDIERFNDNYEMYTGTEYGSSVGMLIDSVSTNNKKDKKHQVIIKYKELETNDSERMKEIKKQLDEWTKYEVTFEYDEKGYIYLVRIEE